MIVFITKDPGITAATHWEVDGTTFVVAFDLLRLEISRFTTDLPESEHGTAFVLVDDEDQEQPAVVDLPELHTRCGSAGNTSSTRRQTTGTVSFGWQRSKDSEPNLLSGLSRRFRNVGARPTEFHQTPATESVAETVFLGLV